MGEAVFLVYMVVALVGILGVFFLLPKRRRKEILDYIDKLDK